MTDMPMLYADCFTGSADAGLRLLDLFRGLLLGAALGTALLGADLLRLARLLELLALLGGGFTHLGGLEDDHGPDRLLPRPRVGAREAEGTQSVEETTTQASSISHCSSVAGLGATSRGISHMRRSRIPGITSDSWILLTTSPVDCTVYELTHPPLRPCRSA